MARDRRGTHVDGHPKRPIDQVWPGGHYPPIFPHRYRQIGVAIKNADEVYPVGDAEPVQMPLDSERVQYSKFRFLLTVRYL